MVRYDLHIHTYYSPCAVNSPKEIIEQAEKLGLNGIAITDHDTFEGLHEALEIETDLMIVPGIEISTNMGHILALGVADGEIERGLPPKEVADLVHRLGGIVVPAHPFDYIRLGIKKEVYNIPCDALEVINGCSTLPRWNKLARKAALELDLPMIAGSDGHAAFEIGIAWTDFLTEPQTWQELISMILKKESIPKGTRHNLLTSKIKRYWLKFKNRKNRPETGPPIRRFKRW